MTSATLLAVPWITAVEGIGPTAVLDVPEPIRAVVIFALVVVFGGVVLARHGEFVDRSVDASMESPLKGLVYGVVLQGGLVMAWGYLYANVLQFVAPGSIVGLSVLAAGAASLLVVAGVGLTVVGASVFDVVSYRQLWPGLIVGAGLGAGATLVPIPAVAVAIWVVVVGVGVGGPTRRWVHDDRVRTNG